VWQSEQSTNQTSFQPSQHNRWTLRDFQPSYTYIAECEHAISDIWELNHFDFHHFTGPYPETDESRPNFYNLFWIHFNNIHLPLVSQTLFLSGITKKKIVWIFLRSTWPTNAIILDVGLLLHKDAVTNSNYTHRVEWQVD
jgi:hypothetical protein